MTLPSAKDELAALRPVVDDEHLARREVHGPVTLVIEAIGARCVSHPHGDIVFSGRHHEALIDPRRAIAGNPGRWQVRSIDLAAVDIEFDIEGPAYPRAILHPAHVRRQLG